jgi:hypothetical protein
MTPPWSMWPWKFKRPWPGFDAYPEVARAFAEGRLERQPCKVCGWWFGEAHHADYDKPLDVVFLCQHHHRQFHNTLKKRFLLANRRRYTVAFHNRVLLDLCREYLEPELPFREVAP